MIDRRQAEEIAEKILEKPRAELRAEREKQARLVERQRQLRIHFVPVLIAALATGLAAEYVDSTGVGILIGVAIGALAAWAARRDERDERDEREERQD